jgi:hypothetical protein
MFECLVWWSMTIAQLLRRQRQKDLKLKASLGTKHKALSQKQKYDNQD